MKKHGFTLIETIMAIFIFSIIVTIVLDFYSFNITFNDRLLKKNQDLVNAYIASDYIRDLIRNNKIEVLNKNNYGRLEILRTSDGNLLYLQGTNGILKYISDSQQITYNIQQVYIEKQNQNLYKITIVTKSGRKLVSFIGAKQ